MTSMNRNPHIRDLQYETLVKIFKYLSAVERNIASETCHFWYSAANDYLFLKNKLITFNFLKACRAYDKDLKTFLNSKTSFCKYKFVVNIKLEIEDDFWIHLGNNIKVLKIIGKFNLNNIDIVHILKSCKNLEALSLSCKFLWVPNHLEIESNYELPNLKSLDLSSSELSDAIFYILVQYCPEVKKLNLFECNLTREEDLAENCETNNSAFSQTEFTFSCVMNFIKTRSKKIKHLSLPCSYDSVLYSLIECKDLFLESLTLGGDLRDQTAGAFTILIQRQSLLKQLQISSLLESEDLIVDICRYLPNLEYLYLNHCIGITDFGFKELHKLKKLKCFHPPFPFYATTEGLRMGLCKEKNYTLKALKVPHCLSLEKDCMILMIAESCPNLRYLDLSECTQIVSDTSLCAIFKHLLQLKELILTGCKEIYNLGKYHNENNEPSQPDLSNLKRLKRLDLACCLNVTNESIERSLRLPRLVSLCLWACKNITNENIKSVVSNCPNLQYLILGSCTNITAANVILSVSSLQNFKLLTIGCHQYTVSAVKTIGRRMKNMNLTELTNIQEWN